MHRLMSRLGVVAVAMLVLAAARAEDKDKDKDKNKAEKIAADKLPDKIKKAINDRFPGAEIVAVRSNAAEEEISVPLPVTAQPSDEVGYVDELDTENDI